MGVITVNKFRRITLSALFVVYFLSFLTNAKGENSDWLGQATAAGNYVKLICSEPLDSTTAPDASNFTISVNQGPDIIPTSTIVNENIIELTLLDPVQAQDKLTITYTPDTSNPTKDINGNLLAAFIDYPVNNTTADSEAPILMDAIATANQINLSYDQPLNPGSIPEPGDIIIKVNNDAGTTPAMITITGNQVTLSLNSTIRLGDRVSLSYRPGVHPIENQIGQAAPPLINQSAINNMVKSLNQYYYDRSNHMIMIKNENSQKCYYQYDRNGNLLRRGSSR